MATLTVYITAALLFLVFWNYGVHQLLAMRFFEKFYIFTPDKLHKICLRSIEEHSPNTEAIVHGVVDRLKADQSTSKYLNLRHDWILNNAGGAMGAMYILHASITEYIILFGTAVGTEGHTGRLTADDYFLILQGTQLAFAAGSFEAEEYPQGSVHHLPRGQAKQMKMPGLCFAVGYARGWIPGLLALGYADGIFSTMDYRTLWETTKITAREVVGNLIRGKF